MTTYPQCHKDPTHLGTPKNNVGCTSLMVSNRVPYAMRRREGRSRKREGEKSREEGRGGKGGGEEEEEEKEDDEMEREG